MRSAATIKRVVAQRSRRLDGHDPAGVDAQIGGLHAVSVTRNRRCGQKKAPRERGALFGAVSRAQRLIASPFTSTSTRRFGARQAISSFIAVMLQTTPGTGCVLPMPRVSILSFGTPFDTR